MFNPLWNMAAQTCKSVCVWVLDVERDSQDTEEPHPSDTAVA